MRSSRRTWFWSSDLAARSLDAAVVRTTQLRTFGFKAAWESEQVSSYVAAANLF